MWNRAATFSNQLLNDVFCERFDRFDVHVFDAQTFNDVRFDHFHRFFDETSNEMKLDRAEVVWNDVDVGEVDPAYRRVAQNVAKNFCANEAENDLLNFKATILFFN